jgi:hypothetical protein
MVYTIDCKTIKTVNHKSLNNDGNSVFRINIKDNDGNIVYSTVDIKIINALLLNTNDKEYIESINHMNDMVINFSKFKNFLLYRINDLNLCREYNQSNINDIEYIIQNLNNYLELYDNYVQEIYNCKDLFMKKIMFLKYQNIFRNYLYIVDINCCFLNGSRLFRCFNFDNGNYDTNIYQQIKIN